MFFDKVTVPKFARNSAGGHQFDKRKLGFPEFQKVQSMAAPRFTNLAV
jgi:hypothetical protein